MKLTKTRNISQNMNKYSGFNTDDFPLAEQCFKTNIIVLSLRKDDQTVQTEYSSLNNFKTTLYMLIYNNHLMYIRDYRQMGSLYVLWNQMKNN